jgi:hypothetical protein
MMRQGYKPFYLPAASGVILHSNGNLDPACIASAGRPPYTHTEPTTVSCSAVKELLYFLSASPIVAEGLHPREGPRNDSDTDAE